MTRLRVSVLSWVSRLRPVVAQENCMLACTRIVILRHLPQRHSAYATVAYAARSTRYSSSSLIFSSNASVNSSRSRTFSRCSSWNALICSRRERAAKLAASIFDGPPAADASLAARARDSGGGEARGRSLRHRWYVIGLIPSARRISDRRFPCAASSSAWRSLAAISAGECLVPVIPVALLRCTVDRCHLDEPPQSRVLANPLSSVPNSFPNGFRRQAGCVPRRSTIRYDTNEAASVKSSDSRRSSRPASRDEFGHDRVHRLDLHVPVQGQWPIRQAVLSLIVDRNPGIFVGESPGDDSCRLNDVEDTVQQLLGFLGDKLVPQRLVSGELVVDDVELRDHDIEP